MLLHSDYILLAMSKAVCAEPKKLGVPGRFGVNRPSKITKGIHAQANEARVDPDQASKVSTDEVKNIVRGVSTI